MITRDPQFDEYGEKIADFRPGMTLRDWRDWFAGQALAGLLANPQTDPKMTWEDIAKVTYAASDAMLAERESDRVEVSGRKLQRAMEALEAIRRSRWASGCDHVAAVREAIADIEAMQ